MLVDVRVRSLYRSAGNDKLYTIIGMLYVKVREKENSLKTHRSCA